MIVRIFRNVGNVSVQPQIVRVVRVYNYNTPTGINESVFGQKGEILVGTGEGAYLVFPPGVDGTYLKYDSTQPAGVIAETPTFEVSDTTNHLVNGGFSVVQRQTPGALTTIADGGYGPDRWKCTRENADLQFIRQDGSSESDLTSPHYGQFKKITNAGKFLICQPIENLDTLKFRGNDIIFQLKMKASAAQTIKIAIAQLTSSGTADTIPTLVSVWGANSTDPTLGTNLSLIGTPQSCAVTTAWAQFSFTGTFPATAKNLLLMVWTDADFAANDTLSLAEAGLYFGSTVKTWTPRPITEEINLCRRYYWKTFPFDVAPAQNAGGIGIRFIAGKAGAGAQIVQREFPVTMLTTPTMTTFNPSAANAQVRDGTASVDCSATATAANTSAFQVTATGNGSTAVGNILVVHVSAEAEL